MTDNPTPSELEPACLCWCCDRMLSVDAGVRPELGDLAMCSYCGALAVIGPDLTTGPPADEVLELLASDPVWRADYVDRLRRAAALRDPDR